MTFLKRLLLHRHLSCNMHSGENEGLSQLGRCHEAPSARLDSGRLRFGPLVNDIFPPISVTVTCPWPPLFSVMDHIAQCLLSSNGTSNRFLSYSVTVQRCCKDMLLATVLISSICFSTPNTTTDIAPFVLWKLKTHLRHSEIFLSPTVTVIQPNRTTK